MIEKYCHGKIPKQIPSPIYLEHIGEKIERLEFDLVLKEIWQAVDKANLIIDENEPWKLAKDENKRGQLEEVLSQLASLLYDLAAAIRPFMPSTAAVIIGNLSAEKITKGEPLFKRI